MNILKKIGNSSLPSIDWKLRDRIKMGIIVWVIVSSILCVTGGFWTIFGIVSYVASIVAYFGISLFTRAK